MGAILPRIVGRATPPSKCSWAQTTSGAPMPSASATSNRALHRMPSWTISFRRALANPDRPRFDRWGDRPTPQRLVNEASLPPDGRKSESRLGDACMASVKRPSGAGNESKPSWSKGLQEPGDTQNRLRITTLGQPAPKNANAEIPKGLSNFLARNTRPPTLLTISANGRH